MNRPAVPALGTPTRRATSRRLRIRRHCPAARSSLVARQESARLRHPPSRDTRPSAERTCPSAIDGGDAHTCAAARSAPSAEERMGKSGGSKKGGGPKAGGGPVRAGKAGGRAAAGPAGGKTDVRGRRAGDQSGQGGKARHCGASHRAVTAQFTAKLRQAGLQLAEVERDGARFLVGLGWGRVYFRERQLDPVGLVLFWRDGACLRCRGRGGAGTIPGTGSLPRA